jgi:hypothetical protein
MAWWNALTAGVRVGVAAGSIAGMIAGFWGSLFTGSPADSAALAANIFLLMAIMLPALFFVYNAATLPPAHELQMRAAIAWLPALLLSIAVFMIPVVMIPLVLNRGVTFENSSNWYAQVFDALGLGRVLLVAVVSAVGFIAVARVVPR